MQPALTRAFREGLLVACLALLGAARPAPARAQAQPVTPPELVSRVDAAYPPEALAARKEAQVVLDVTVSEQGEVTAAEVVTSGGEAFDLSAQAAVKQWRFKPAQRGEVPIASRIRVPFRFALPPPRPPEPQPVAQPAPPEPQPAAPDAQRDEQEAVEVTVRGTRRPPRRATSDFVLDRDVLVSVERQSAGELLGAAPGVYISRPEGEAVAHEITLRGFNAEHGQDVELTVGPVPVNQPSHIHGQGYADLNFLIPEVVRSLRVTEGVYDPRQGNFAVAGSVDFDLGVVDRGVHTRTSYGSFNTVRQLVLWAPRGEAEETFGAAAIRSSEGFGQNRGSLSGQGMGQYAFQAPHGFRGLVSVAAHGARAGLAGVLRRDDVAAGRVGFYDSYPDPSANAQSAFAARAHAAVNLERTGTSGAKTGIAVWLAFVDFRSRVNFTGYTQRSQLMPLWVGRGDLIEQSNRDVGLGARVFYRTRVLRPWSWLTGAFEVGLQLRTHFIDQTQNLLQAPQNETWDRRVDASIREGDLGLYADADFRITRWLTLRGGGRLDVLYFDVDDRLGHFQSSFDRMSHIPGFRRTAAGVAGGPRLSLSAHPTGWLDLIASYGEGFRSPQARQLEEGESAPFAKVRSVEGGFRLHFAGERYVVTGAGYATFLSTDLAFDPEEGRVERIGPTSRKGVVVHGVVRPWSWAALALSVTWVHATLDAPPPATAEDPAPAYQPGQLLPYVPPVVLRADLTLRRALFALRGRPFVGRFGAGLTHLSGRPLPYSRVAEPVTLLDLSASVRWWFVEVGFDVYNVAGSQYAATEYSFVSDWRTREVPSLVPARHFSAGAPRTYLGTLAFHF